MHAERLLQSSELQVGVGFVYVTPLSPFCGSWNISKQTHPSCACLGVGELNASTACRDMSFLKWLEGTDEDSVEGDSNVKGIGPMSGGMTLLEDEEDDSSGSLRSEVDLSGEEEYTLAPGRHQAMASMDSMEVDLQMMMSPEFSLQEWLTLRRELDLLQVEDRRESQLPTGMPSEEHSHQQPVPPLEEDQLRMTPKPMTRLFFVWVVPASFLFG